MKQSLMHRFLLHFTYAVATVATVCFSHGELVAQSNAASPAGASSGTTGARWVDWSSYQTETRGLTGAAGSTGVGGAAGAARGATGAVSYTGATGQTGSIGYTGSVGSGGYTGSYCGCTGSTGATGVYDIGRLHPDAFYHVIGLRNDGSVMELHDGSWWEIDLVGANYAPIYWQRNDILFIKPSVSCFSVYRYAIYNFTRDEVVSANCISAPFSSNPAAFVILNIDYDVRLVELSDGTVWSIDLPNSSVYSWSIGDRIIVGVSNGWRRSTQTRPHILINLDLYREPYARANLAGYAY